MNLNDLVEHTDWWDVKARLLALYPKEERSVRGYEEVWRTLLVLSPQPTFLRLVLEWVEDETVGEKPFVDVCGKDGSSMGW